MVPVPRRVLVFARTLVPSFVLIRRVCASSTSNANDRTKSMATTNSTSAARFTRSASTSCMRYTRKVGDRTHIRTVIGSRGLTHSIRTSSRVSRSASNVNVMSTVIILRLWYM